MRRKRERSKKNVRQKISLAACLTIFLLVICMIVPVSTALSAGIAALSVVIFGISMIICCILWLYGGRSERVLVGTALAAATFGLVVPQIAFFATANRHDLSLSFNPFSYVTFSGNTTINPTRLIPYKKDNGRDMKLAYYESKINGERPAVLLLHGGGWRYGNYLETGDWPRLLTDKGFHVFSVEYRLASDTYHTWRDAPGDVHEAIGYVQDQAAALSIDRKQIHLLGQSAGGHLALLEAYLYNDVTSVVSLYAPIDLALDYQTSRDKGSELDFIGGPPSQYANRYRAVSPITYVSGQAPRTLIIQGKTDDLVSPENATRLSDALTKNDVSHELVSLPLTGHSFENQRGGFATQITEQQVVRFLSQ